MGDEAAVSDVWSSVKVGDVVEDAKGRAWTVTGRSGSSVRIHGARAGKPMGFEVTPDPDSPVKVLARATAPTSMTECVETVTATLGGTVIASIDSGGVMTCPLVKEMNAGVLLKHLQAVHGEPLRTSRLPVRELRDLHEFGHEMGVKDKAFTPHEHVLG